MSTPQDAPPAPKAGQPTHGFTKLGHAVHKRTLDHLPTDSAYQRFNKQIALALTKYIGTMTTFWVFCLLSLLSLPAVLSGFSVFHSAFPSIIIKASIIALVAWVAQTFIQLVLLPALMVGQNLQNEAADARAAKTFEDVEEARIGIKRALELLERHTEGGIKAILDSLEDLKGGSEGGQLTLPVTSGGGPPIAAY